MAPINIIRLSSREAKRRGDPSGIQLDCEPALRAHNDKPNAREHEGRTIARLWRFVRGRGLKPD
jgi:hypothetical protein